jgi:hypothetical protein
MSTAAVKPCLAISASRLAATSRLPEAWQADPEQSVMQGFWGSLLARRPFPNFSNSDGEFIRDIILP